MVEESINYWRHFIQNTTGTSVNLMHSIGAFFRLFAHDFLPKNVEHVLYMDTDVAVLANLQELWRLRNHSTIFQWVMLLQFNLQCLQRIVFYSYQQRCCFLTWQDSPWQVGCDPRSNKQTNQSLEFSKLLPRISIHETSPQENGSLFCLIRKVIAFLS